MKRKYIPNILSVCRIPISLSLLFLGKRPVAFIAVYAIAGVADVLDGIIARKFHWESPLGQKLDSIGDGVFVASALLAAIFAIELKISLYNFIIFAVLIAIRVANMVITWVRFRRVGFIHTRSTRWSAFPIYVLLPVSVYLGYLPNPPLAVALVLVSLAQLEETWILFAMKKGEYTMAIKSYWEWKRGKALAVEIEPEKQEAIV